jgi:protein-S-isoprenylcysteine O-methyltransferase Ste14
VKQKHFIDTHKGATAPAVLILMASYGAWDNGTAWTYLAMHGGYGLLWLLKSRSFPDRRFERRCGLAYGLYIWAGLTLYWITPWLIVSQDLRPPPWIHGLAVASFGIGVFLHFASDMQKHVTLERGPTLITTGLWARTRNPNYLGELLIYGSFAALAWTWSWLPFLVLGLFVVVVWWPAMRRKDRSLARYPEFEGWRGRTGLWFPRLL